MLNSVYATTVQAFVCLDSVQTNGRKSTERWEKNRVHKATCPSLGAWRKKRLEQLKVTCNGYLLSNAMNQQPDNTKQTNP